MRILSIDYGKKRTGIAVTDPLQIIANGLITVATPELFAFVEQYIPKGAGGAYYHRKANPAQRAA